MADIINLRQKRKDKKRDEKDKQASGNRALFGESKNERSLREHEREKVDKTMDGAKRDRPDGDVSS
jgi:hypothetical protein